MKHIASLIPLQKKYSKSSTKILLNLITSAAMICGKQVHLVNIVYLSTLLKSRSEKKKLEYLNGTLNMARVIPVLVEGRELVLELFQNLSSSYFKTEDRFEQISKIVEDQNTLA